MFINFTKGKQIFKMLAIMNIDAVPFDRQYVDNTLFLFSDAEVFLSPMTDALDVSLLRTNNEWDMKAGPAKLSAVYYSHAYGQVSYEIYLKVRNFYD